jgi:hypothetical protein
VRSSLWPEPLDRWVLSDFPLELKARLRLGDAGWGEEAIFMTKGYALAADRAGWDLELLDPSRSPLWSAATIDSPLVDHCQGMVG